MVRFRPAPLPSAFVAVALVILVNLGMWQLRRHHEAEDARARVEQRVHGAPLGADDLEGDAQQLAWHQAELEGRFLPLAPQLITGRFEFGSPGFDVVQAFEVQDGPVLLVNRGWIPLDDHAAALEQITGSATSTTLQGLLLELTGDPNAEPLPPQGPSPERWPARRSTGCRSATGVDYAAMARHLQIEAAPVVLVEGPLLQSPHDKKPEPLPVSGFIAKPKTIGHLSYAGQWFSIAAVLLGLWAWAGVRRAKLG